MSEQEKICSMLNQGDDSFIQWHRKEFKTGKMEGLTYDILKKNVLEAPGRKITFGEFWKQNSYEKNLQYSFLKKWKVMEND